MTGTSQRGVDLEPNAESLADGTLTLQPGQTPNIVFDFGETPFAFRRRRKGRAFDFDQKPFNTMVKLIKDENSKLYNFGSLLVSKMKEIKDEKQVYYWKLRKNVTDAEQKKLREQYAGYKNVPFVRMGDFSDDTVVGKKGRAAGEFDQLSKPEGTTNCSTAVLDALYRALGGKINKKGRVIKVGGVNGVPLTDRAFSGFPKKFQGTDWDDAIVEHGLGYKVAMKDLRHGDIISMPGHRMIYLETVKDKNGVPSLIKTIEAKPPTGKNIVRRRRTIGAKWKAARIFDIAP